MQALLVGIGDCADSAFGNNIDVDTIVVMGSAMTVFWIIACISRVGAYVFKLWQNRIWTCMFITVIASVLCGGLTILLSYPISHVFTLTERQYEMLQPVLCVYGGGIVIVGIGDVVDNYCLMKGRMKALFAADIVYYVLLIGLDALVVYRGMSCTWLVVGTIFSYLVFDIMLMFSSGILQESKVFNKKDCVECVKHGCNFLIGKTVIRVAIVVMRTLASGLGTLPYAIYTVANSVEEFNENYTASFENFCTINIKRRLPEDRTKCVQMLRRKYTLFLLICICGSIPITSIFLKGELDYLTVVLYACLPCIGNILALLSRPYYAYLMAEEQSNALKWEGVLGSVVRVVCGLGGMLFGAGLVWFLLCYPIDCLIRSIWVYACNRKLRNKANLKAVMQSDLT